MLSLFFNKVSGLMPANFIKKETLPQLHSCEFCEFFRYTFLTVHIWTTASVFYKIDPERTKRKALRQVFSRKFCKIYQNTNFGECLHTAAMRKTFCGGVQVKLLPSNFKLILLTILKLLSS